MIDKNKYIKYVDEVMELYYKRQFKVNSNGMRLNHYLLFLYLKQNQISVESGVDKGQTMVD